MRNKYLPHSWSERASIHLSGLVTKGLLRSIIYYDNRLVDSLLIGTDSLINFSSNDYLGLSFHPTCIDASINAVHQQGCSSSSSLLVSGGVPPHSSLQHMISSWIGSESCLIYPTGYQANVGVISALASPGDSIFSDEFNHASIIDGCRLSHADVYVYPHLDYQTLSKLLNTRPKRFGNRLIVTDSLFSMDGSRAPLPFLSLLAKEYEALFIVDESHAIGVLGPNGQGLCSSFSIIPDVLIGSFSKALGSQGAFVCTSKLLASYLAQQSRGLMYSTALPPSVAAVNIAAAQIVNSIEGDSLRKRVIGSANHIRSFLLEHGILSDGQDSPFVSIEFFDHLSATLVSGLLRDLGFLACAFRPPTVPFNTSRLRLNVSASHCDAQLTGVSNALCKSIQRMPSKNFM